MGNIKYSCYWSHLYILLIFFDLLVFRGKEPLPLPSPLASLQRMLSPRLLLGHFRTIKSYLNSCLFSSLIPVIRLTSHSTEDQRGCLPPCLCYLCLPSDALSVSSLRSMSPFWPCIHSLQFYLVSLCLWILHTPFIHTVCPIFLRTSDSYWESNYTLYGQLLSGCQHSLNTASQLSVQQSQAILLIWAWTLYPCAPVPPYLLCLLYPMYPLHLLHPLHPYVPCAPCTSRTPVSPVPLRQGVKFLQSWIQTLPVQKASMLPGHHLWMFCLLGAVFIGVVQPTSPHYWTPIFFVPSPFYEMGVPCRHHGGDSCDVGGSTRAPSLPFPISSSIPHSGKKIVSLLSPGVLVHVKTHF